MPFTTLNQAASEQVKAFPTPAWLRHDFSELPDDVFDSIAALWNGKAHLLSKDATQKAIRELRNLVIDLKGKIQVQPSIASSGRADSPSKKRGLEDAEQVNGHAEKKPRIPISQSSISGSWKGTRFDGVSFTIPQRKKLSLTIASSKREGLLVTTADMNTPEFGIPWSQIEDVICLPVPEKTQAQKSFVIFPKGVNGLSEITSSNYETMVWTVPDTRVKGASEDEPTQAQAIKTALSQSVKVLEPDPKDFTSEIPPIGGKKGERAYHIKAFRGSKDGFLFLLPRGIIWAFKKPLIFFAFSSIDSISYTSVLQRTFNLVISARSSVEADTEAQAADYEFSMLDQTDFAGIDAYIKQHGLQDASLAEQRRARLYNVNGKKGEGPDANAEPGNEGDVGAGESELQKAQREARGADAANAADANDEMVVEGSDDEDEDQNFDPGSDGESEGSGSEEEEDDEHPAHEDNDNDEDDDDEDDEDEEDLGSGGEDV